MAHKARVSRPAQFAEMTALVIDDDDTTLMTMKALLGQLGIRAVATATDGDEGYGAVVQRKPDVVFCDIRMQPVGGIGFVRQLRSATQPEIAETPVVMLTSDAQTENVTEAAKHRVHGYLMKPPRLAKLEDSLRKVLEG